MWNIKLVSMPCHSASLYRLVFHDGGRRSLSLERQPRKLSRHARLDSTKFERTIDTYGMECCQMQFSAPTENPVLGEAS